LFYVERCVGAGCPDGTAAARNSMMSVAFAAASFPRVGAPRPLFVIESGSGWGCLPVRCYDVSPDGQRFFVRQTAASVPAPPVTHVNLVQNWVEELKAKVPGGQAK